jgi:hypothetical protein
VFCSNPELFQLRLSATQNNLIFATNGESKLSVFDLELNLLWSVNIPNVNTSSAAIGSNGVIAVSGSNAIKVYTPGVNVGIKDESGKQELLVYPVPFTRNFNIMADPRLAGSEFRVYDLSGKLVKRGILTSFNTSVEAEDLAEGIYYLVCKESGKQIIKSAKP